MQPAIKNTIRDHKLPQLSAALDTNLMKYIFQKVLIGLQIEDCQIIQSRYKPERNCLISYRLKIRNTETNEAEEQILCARIFPVSESLSRFVKAQKQFLLAPKFGSALTHISDLEMVVWAFPNDRKLTGLPDLTNLDRLSTEILPSAFGDGYEIKSLRSEIVHYVAEHTCTIKVNLELSEVKTGKTQTQILYGKTYYNDEGAVTFRAMRELENQIHIAQPLAYQPEIKTLWQFGLDGRSLNEYYASDEHLMAKAAAAVAALHQANVMCSRTFTLLELLLKLESSAKLYALSNPSGQQKLTAIIARLMAQSQTLTARPTALLHGDLHLKNFFVVDDEVALIDLDNLTYGDPLQDVGSFIAGLWYSSLQPGAVNPQSQISAFLSAYKNHISYSISQSDLNWYVATMLIAERVSRCITRLKSGRSADELIKLADQISGGQQ